MARSRGSTDEAGVTAGKERGGLGSMRLPAMARRAGRPPEVAETYAGQDSTGSAARTASAQWQGLQNRRTTAA